MSGNLTWSDLPSLRRRARVPRPALASIRKPRWRQKSRDSRAESLPELPRHGAARDIPPAPMFLSGESGPHQLRVIGAKLFPLRSDDYAKSVRSSLFNSRLQKSRRKKEDKMLAQQPKNVRRHGCQCALHRPSRVRTHFPILSRKMPPDPRAPPDGLKPEAGLGMTPVAPAVHKGCPKYDPEPGGLDVADNDTHPCDCI